MMYAVIKKDGTFAGRCCETIEAARELACQESGRRVYALIEDNDTTIINSVLESSEKVFECPVYDYGCPYCDEYGYCELENPQEECESMNTEYFMD